MSTDLLTDLETRRRTVTTAYGPASVLDCGGPGPAAVFVHGIGTNALLWRHVLQALAGRRRLVAIDLPLHGHTPMCPGQDVTLPALARFVAGCCDALGLETVHLVGNDTGGAVSQVFAAQHPDRLASLTLTNCEARDNVPPRAVRPAVLLARLGLLTPLVRLGARRFQRNPKAGHRMFRSSYQDATRLPEAVAWSFVQPLAGSGKSAKLFQRWLLSIRARDLLAVEPQLRSLHAPTLIVWGTGDRFFDRSWAQWLRDTIPGALDVRYLDGGRLLFPDEHAGELVAALDTFWTSLRVGQDQS